MAEYTPRHAKRNRFKDCFDYYALPLGILAGGIVAAAVLFTVTALKII